MTNLVIETLGEERVNQICQEAGLTPAEKETVEKVIEEWEKLVGKIEAKIEAAVRLIGNNPRRTRLINVLLKINTEFAAKRMERFT